MLTTATLYQRLLALLREIPYKDLVPVQIKLPPKQRNRGYKRPRKSAERGVPKIY